MIETVIKQILSRRIKGIWTVRPNPPGIYARIEKDGSFIINSLKLNAALLSQYAKECNWSGEIVIVTEEENVNWSNVNEVNALLNNSQIYSVNDSRSPFQLIPSYSAASSKVRAVNLINSVFRESDTMGWSDYTVSIISPDKVVYTIKRKKSELITTLLSIEYTLCKNGYMRPVGYIDPISYKGMLISQISGDDLYNFIKKGIRIGDTLSVSISTQNLHLASINSVLIKNDDSDRLVLPSACPSCSKKLSNDGGMAIRCTNSLDCPEINIMKIIHWCDRYSLEIVLLGSRLIRQLATQGIITDIDSLYQLDSKSLITVPNISHFSANLIVSSIESSKRCHLSAFICGIGIPHIKRNSARAIAWTYGSIDNFYKNNEKYRDRIKPFLSDQQYLSMVDYVKEPKNILYISKLAKLIKPKDVSIRKKHALNKAVVCITGMFNEDEKSDIESLLAKSGIRQTDIKSGKATNCIIGKNPKKNTKKISRLRMNSLLSTVID